MKKNLEKATVFKKRKRRNHNKVQKDKIEKRKEEVKKKEEKGTKIDLCNVKTHNVLRCNSNECKRIVKGIINLIYFILLNF